MKRVPRFGGRLEYQIAAIPGVTMATKKAACAAFFGVLRRRGAAHGHSLQSSTPPFTVAMFTLP